MSKQSSKLTVSIALGQIIAARQRTQPKYKYIYFFYTCHFLVWTELNFGDLVLLEQEKCCDKKSAVNVNWPNSHSGLLVVSLAEDINSQQEPGSKINPFPAASQFVLLVLHPLNSFNPFPLRQFVFVLVPPHPAASQFVLLVLHPLNSFNPFPLRQFVFVLVPPHSFNPSPPRECLVLVLIPPNSWTICFLGNLYRQF